MLVALIPEQVKAQESPLIGDTPLVLSAEVEKNFQTYLNMVHPQAFAVSADGLSSGMSNVLSRCGIRRRCSNPLSISKAISICNKRNVRGGGLCKIYALKGDVVWKGGVLLKSVQDERRTLAFLAGKGPLTLAQRVIGNFQDYLSFRYPLAFAVSSDGKSSGWYFCNQEKSCLKADAVREAINFCNGNTARACKTYAVRRDVVWKGNVSVMSAFGPQPMAKSPLYGRGPVILTPRVNAYFQDYVNLRHPLAFAVSANGKNSGWYFCKEKNGCFTADAKQTAIRYCNSSARSGGTCRIYAIGRTVVWD